jgi:hypothetical protein
MNARHISMRPRRFIRAAPPELLARSMADDRTECSTGNGFWVSVFVVVMGVVSSYLLVTM